MRGSGGGGGTFDHPLETPWSFSGLDKPPHPLFKPGQQRRSGSTVGVHGRGPRSGSTGVVKASPLICLKVCKTY